MDWSRIPSLAALRAFDALARRRTLSAAARELNVTHAAISQHLRGLETHFGQTLAQRDGQMFRLTEQGEALALALEDGFSTIAEGVTSLMDATAQGPVRVTLTPTFAETWLMPRIGRFWQAHPDVELHLNPSAGLADLRRDGLDMGIRFGRGTWPGVSAEPFLHSSFVVVTAPHYTPHNRLEEMGDLNLLPWFYSPGSKEHGIWGEALGVDFARPNVQAMETHGMVISAVRSGLGLAIEARTLVEADIASGQLKPLYEGEAQGLGYYIITRPGAVLSPGAQAFRKWLLREAQAQV